MVMEVSVLKFILMIKLQLEAFYLAPKQINYFVSKYYSFNHGVYSKNIFDFTLES